MPYANSLAGQDNQKHAQTFDHRGQEAHRSSLPGLVVLLVQSDPDNLAMYADFLELHGHVCVRASSTADALIVAPTADVVVTGIQVPGHSDGVAVVGDGIDLIGRLKADSRTMRVPAIVLTTNSLATERARAEQAGCSSFLTKPCLPEDLLSEVRRVAGESDRG